MQTLDSLGRSEFLSGLLNIEYTIFTYSHSICNRHRIHGFGAHFILPQTYMSSDKVLKFGELSEKGLRNYDGTF